MCTLPRSLTTPLSLSPFLLVMLAACGGDNPAGPPPSQPLDPVLVATTGPAPAHMVISNGVMFWSETSETPIMSVSLAGGAPVPLAIKVEVPVSVAADGADLIWLEEREGEPPCPFQSGLRVLRRTSKGITAILAKGSQCTPSTPDLVLAGGDIFWVTAGLSGDVIQRTPVRGGPTTAALNSTVPVVALHGNGQYLYWMENDFPNPAGAIRRAPLAGGPTETIVSGFTSEARTFAVNGAFAFYHVAGPPGVEQLFAVPSSGGSPALLATIGAPPEKLAADETTVYWVDAEAVWAVPVAGGTPVKLADVTGQPLDLLVRAADVVWSEELPASSGAGQVRRVPKAGGVATVIATGENAPQRLAADANWVYWVEGGPLGEVRGFGRLARAPAAGGAGETVVSGVARNSPPIAVSDQDVVIADIRSIKRVSRQGGRVRPVSSSGGDSPSVATDGVHAFWLEEPELLFHLGNPEATLRSAPLDGGVATSLTGTMPPGAPGGPMYFRQGSVYWMTEYTTIQSVGAGGGAVRAVAPDVPLLSDFVVDDEQVYWSEMVTGRIGRAALTGGEQTILAEGSYGWKSLAVDASSVYWIDARHLTRIPRAGGPITSLNAGKMGNDPAEPSSIAVDGQFVYWTEPLAQRIRKLPK
jgi:hypothetical protein